MSANKEIRFLTSPKIAHRQKKYCRFKKAGIRYIDYKDPEFLLNPSTSFVGQLA